MRKNNQCYLMSCCSMVSISFTNFSLQLSWMSESTRRDCCPPRHSLWGSVAPASEWGKDGPTSGITLFNMRDLNWSKHLLEMMEWRAKRSLWCCRSGNDLMRLLISWMEFYSSFTGVSLTLDSSIEAWNCLAADWRVAIHEGVSFIETGHGDDMVILVSLP